MTGHRTGYRPQDTGHRTQDTGHREQARTQNTHHRTQDTGHRRQDARHRTRHGTQLHCSNTAKRTRRRSQTFAKPAFPNTSERTMQRSQTSAKTALFQHLRVHQVEEPEVCQSCTFPTHPNTPDGGARTLPKLHFPNTSDHTRWRSQTSAKTALLQHLRAYQAEEPDMCQQTALFQHLRAHQVVEP